MRVSGKITHSFYCFLRTRGFDISRFFDMTSLEMEFLKDHRGWLDLAKVELFLKNLSQEYGRHFVDQDFIICVGHSCFDLGAWGELDSVLKMPKESSPATPSIPIPRFLSYFIEDITLVEKGEKIPGFSNYRSNLSTEEYPCVTEYLRAVLESLPLYTGGQRATAQWSRHDIQLKWNENQQSSLFHSDPELHVKPELLSDVRRFLVNLEKEMNRQRDLIKTQEQEIQQLKEQLSRSRSHPSEESN